MTTLANALQELAPNAEYTTRDGTYASLIWHSDISDKPTEDEVNALHESAKHYVLRKNEYLNSSLVKEIL